MKLVLQLFDKLVERMYLFIASSTFSMHLLKRCCAFVLISLVFACTSVLALGAVTISPINLSIQPGDTVSFTASPLGASGAVSYEWYIDGLLLTWFTTSALSLDWSDYADIFPNDTTNAATRDVTVVATDTINAETWSATLTVTHPLVPEAYRGNISGGDNYCGDGVVRVELGEFCDDGNGKKGDGCTMNCECEAGWICTVDESGTKSVIERDTSSDDDTGGQSWDGQWTDGDGSSSNENGSSEGPDTDDDTDANKPKRSVIDILAEKNRDPMRLSENSPLKAYMPVDTPQTWASLELLRKYMATDSHDAIISDEADWSLLRPIGERSLVYPKALPNTGLAELFKPKRIINL